MTWYVYLLLCDQKLFYIGITNDLPHRLAQHKSKQSFYTRQFAEVVLKYCEKYVSKEEAVHREKQLKGWSRAKKQMLIDGELGYNRDTEIVEVLS